LIDIGVAEDVTIRELAELVKRVVGYSGKIVFDRSKPDGRRGSYWMARS